MTESGKRSSILISVPKSLLLLPETQRMMLFGKVAEKECSNDQKLKKAIIAAWREIDDDKALCRHLMASMPHRLSFVNLCSEEIKLEELQGRKVV